MIYDVLVIGLGGHGSAIAAHLAERGSKVLGIDKYDGGHSNGSSHGRSRIIRLAYYEDHRYVPLLRRSFELWKELNETRIAKSPAHHSSDADISRVNDSNALLQITGGMMIGLPDSEVILGTIESVTRHNLKHEILTADEIKSRFPLLHVLPSEIGIFESDAGYLVPELCVESYLRRATDNEAALRFNETVTSWSLLPDVRHSDGSEDELKRVGEEASVDFKAKTNKEQEGSPLKSDGDIYKVCTKSTNSSVTSEYTYLTRKIIIAAGAWAPALYGSEIPISLHAERRVQYWFKPKSNEELFKTLPIYIWDAQEDGMFYGFPSQDGVPGGVKVAMHFKKSAEGFSSSVCTPESVNRTVSDEEIEEMRGVIASRIPDMGGEILSTMTCMYTMTEDHHFLIDFHPAHSGVLLLSPCSGHGFKFCSVIGEIAADLILTGSTKHDISLFSLEARKKHTGAHVSS